LERRLAAILAADVAGYSRLMGEDEAGTLRRLTELRQQALEPLITEHRGRVVKLMGDGLLVEFASVVDAITCAVAWQNGVAEHEAEADEDKRLQFRIGVNLGDVIVGGEDIHGDGVNIAARLEGLAEPGGICISGDAYRHGKGKVEAGFEDLGEHDLKNVVEPVQVYRITAASSDSGGATSVIEPLTLPNKPSIAVLPFTNMSGDPEQDYFADGIAEDLITQLSRLRDLFVISRNSTFVFKGQSVPVSQIARDLGVRFVLEGSVRRGGNRLRVTAQLIDAESGGHVWAERYDREVSDLFELQDEITKAVTVALQVNLTEGEVARIAAEGTRDLQAWELYLQGHAAMQTFTKHDNFRARQLFQRAIARDPDYGLAHVEIAITHWLDARFRYTSDPGSSLDQARTIAHRIEETLGETGSLNFLKGNIALFDLHHDEALKFHRRAAELAPNDSFAMAALGMTRMYAGDFQGAVESLKASLRLSPFGINWVIYYLAFAYLWLGELEDARRNAAAYLAREPQEPFAYVVSALVEAACGHTQAARDFISQLRARNPELTCDDFAFAQFYREPKWLEQSLLWLKQAGLRR
jgi:adenylate cyclase